MGRMGPRCPIGPISPRSLPVPKALPFPGRPFAPGSRPLMRKLALTLPLLLALAVGARPAALSSRPPPGKSSESGKTQIWLLDPTGGEPWALTELARDVSLYEWAGPDALVFAAQEEPTRREARLKDDKGDTAVVVEDDTN